MTYTTGISDVGYTLLRLVSLAFFFWLIWPTLGVSDSSYGVVVDMVSLILRSVVLVVLTYVATDIDLIYSVP